MTTKSMTLWPWVWTLRYFELILKWEFLGEWRSEIGCLTSHATIFQLYMLRHIDVQANLGRSWTCGRVPKARVPLRDDFGSCPIIIFSLLSYAQRRIYTSSSFEDKNCLHWIHFSIVAMQLKWSYQANILCILYRTPRKVCYKKQAFDVWKTFLYQFTSYLIG